MSISCVYTIRIPEEVRQMMDEMKDINWQSDIRQAVEELVREKKRHRLLNEARELRKATKNIGVSASELIREDRDAR
jgi:activator of HSP90 ATPase